MKFEGLRCSFAYWDDAVLVGTPQAISLAANLVDELHSKTGLKLKWRKYHLYTVSKSAAKKCEELFNQNVKIHDQLNVVYLNVPIGSNSFVRNTLHLKLAELKTIIDNTASMDRKHEGVALLQARGAECRVMHLMRTLPPRQSKPFITQFDKILRWHLLERQDVSSLDEVQIFSRGQKRKE